MIGAITGYIDVAQLTLYAFWIFFAGLIYYLHQEDKREGYPLISDRSEHISVEGFPAVPAPKTFLLHDGSVVQAPRPEPEAYALKARAAERFPGAPLVPTGNPLVDAVGPAAYALRADKPDVQWDDHQPRLVPLRVDPAMSLAAEGEHPIGMKVFGADDVLAGVVTDVWVDRSEAIVRYLELKVGARSVLAPMTMVKFSDADPGRIDVRALTAAQFADIPGIMNPDVVTLLEEDKIMGYFGGGTLYATPMRSEPLI